MSPYEHNWIPVVEIACEDGEHGEILNFFHILSKSGRAKTAVFIQYGLLTRKLE
jgi:hypothetical protein